MQRTTESERANNRERESITERNRAQRESIRERNRAKRATQAKTTCREEQPGSDDPARHTTAAIRGAKSQTVRGERHRLKQHAENLAVTTRLDARRLQQSEEQSHRECETVTESDTYLPAIGDCSLSDGDRTQMRRRSDANERGGRRN